MKIALVGGATGIGAATLKELRDQRHEVLVLDIQQPEGDIQWIPLDLLDQASITGALAAAGDNFDGLCFVAGIPPKADNAAACLTINTLAACHFITGFLPKMNSGSAIVTVASRAGLGWQDNTEMLDDLLSRTHGNIEAWCSDHKIDPATAYRLSKQAMIYWHQNQVAPHIGKHRFVTVSPSAVRTGILDDFLKAFGPTVAANLQRVGRAGTPEEIAAAISFLVSPKASWINGIDIIIDGGMGALNLSNG